MANGIADILPNKPFQVRVINTSEIARQIPKGMILGHALPHTTEIIALADDEESCGEYRKPPGRRPSPKCDRFGVVLIPTRSAPSTG
jgi:hypothetical protein